MIRYIEVSLSRRRKLISYKIIILNVLCLTNVDTYISLDIHFSRICSMSFNFDAP